MAHISMGKQFICKSVICDGAEMVQVTLLASSS